MGPHGPQFLMYKIIRICLRLIAYFLIYYVFLNWLHILLIDSTLMIDCIFVWLIAICCSLIAYFGIEYVSCLFCWRLFRCFMQKASKEYLNDENMKSWGIWGPMRPPPGALVFWGGGAPNQTATSNNYNTQRRKCLMNIEKYTTNYGTSQQEITINNRESKYTTKRFHTQSRMDMHN